VAAANLRAFVLRKVRNALASTGRICGIDYGTVRFGIAISDASCTIASPYETYQRRGAAADAERFQRLVAEEGVVRYVVGLPVHISGEESSKSREAREFGAWLAQITGLPVDFIDERYSSRQAEEALRDAGLTSRQRKERRDMLAARILLEAYLETGGAAAGEPGPLDDSFDVRDGDE